MPAVIFADGDQDAGRFAGFQDDHDVIGLRPTEVRVDEPCGILIDEGNQISRMTHALIQRLGVPADAPSA